MEPDTSTLAHQVLDVSIGLKPGERVWVNTWDHTLKLAYSLAWECEKRGCPVILTVQPEDLWLRTLTEASLDLIDGLPAHQAALLSETDVYIYTLGPRHPIPWEKIPKDRHKLVTRWFFEKNRFVEQWKAIARRRKVRMVGIEATLATPERARVLGLDHEEWSRVMYDGCVADYHEITRRGNALVIIMAGEGEVHITTPHGTDFRFRLDSRPVDFFGGLLTPGKIQEGSVAFLPAGGAEATADEESGEGTVVYDAPIRTEEGVVEHLSLEVEKGRINHVSAKARQEIFEHYLSKGTGDVDRFAFFGFGLNPGLRHGFTQDDKVLGSVTLGFGDNEEKGGRNRAGRSGTGQSNHWWACMSGATVTIGGKHVMKDGKLLF